MYICSQCLFRSRRPTQLPALTRQPSIRIWPRPTARVVRRRVGTAANSSGGLLNPVSESGDDYKGNSNGRSHVQSAGAAAEQPQALHRKSQVDRYHRAGPSRRESTFSRPPSQKEKHRKFVQAATEQPQDPQGHRLFRYVCPPQLETAPPQSSAQKTLSQNPSPDRIRKPSSPEYKGVNEIIAIKRLRKTKAFTGALSAQIQLEARRLGFKLDHGQLNRELKIRSRSLYPWSIIHRKWRRTFVQHWQEKRKQKGPVGAVWEYFPYKQDEVLSWVKEIVPGADTPVRAMSKAWWDLPRGEKAKRWPFIIQWLLRRSPQDALKFLRATNLRQWPRPPFRMLADCFHYLEAFHRDELTSKLRTKAYYHRILFSCLAPEYFPIAITHGRLQVFLERCNEATLSRAFSEIVQWNIRVSSDTLLLFMDSFAKFHDVENALHALRLAATQKPRPNLDSSIVRNRICNLLKLDEVVDVDGVRNFKILPKILDIGVQPDRDMMNLILSNALSTGDSQIGWDIVHYMKQQGFHLDSYTYVSLIKDAVARRDIEKLDMIFRELDGNEDVRNDPYVTSQTLHALYSLSRKTRNPSKPHSDMFNLMVDIYRRAHDLTPLRELGIIPLHWYATDDGRNTPPSMHSLNIMIAAYLRKLEDPALGGEIFDRFQKMVEQGHKSFGRLAESDHIYNTFLMSFIRSSETLSHCGHVIEQMLQPLPPTAVLEDEGNRQIIQAKPTVRTWTIFLSAFIFRRQIGASEKIKSLMAKQGIEFNDYTFNVMTAGYAKMEMVNETAATFREREKAHVPIDSYTIQAIRKLKDPEKLSDVLNILDEERGTDANNAVDEKHQTSEKQ